MDVSDPIAAPLASGVAGALGRVGAMATMAPLTAAATSGSVIAGTVRLSIHFKLTTPSASYPGVIHMRFVTCVCTAALSALFADSAQAQTSPTVTLSASPTSIPKGLSSTLAWSSANATACSGTGKGFSPSGTSGSLAVSPSATTTYGITCTGAGGSASQSVAVTLTPAPTLTVGETVAATRKIYVYPTPSPSASTIGSEAPGNQGVVIGGPTSDSHTWWEVAFNNNLTGWTYQSDLGAVPAVTTLSPTTGPVAGGTSVTITGTAFTGATAVKFGSTAATSFTVNSATAITAKAPAGSSGMVEVTVTTPYGTSPAH